MVTLEVLKGENFIGQIEVPLIFLVYTDII